MTSTPSVRLRLLMPILAVIVVIAIGSAAAVQRSTATTAADHLQDVHSLLTSMLDQETGLRGFLLTRRESFLEPFRRGTENYSRAYDDLHSDLRGDEDGLAALGRSDVLARRWHDVAEEQISQTRAQRRFVLSVPLALERKRVMDGVRTSNTRLEAVLDKRRADAESRAIWLSTGIGLFVFVLVGGLGTFLVGRRMRQEAAHEAAEREYRDGQSEFIGTLQAVDDETEANLVLKPHLERWVPDRRVTVLNRNNSENRLDARAGGSDLGDRLASAEPRACVAIRLARTYEEHGDKAPLLQCELCGKEGQNALCSPLLVSGRVIGSVLVRQEQPFDENTERRVSDSVSPAAPVLANLRAIAMAESRAHTDALTGLPNRRAVNDTLKRMVAQAHRFERPLAAIVIDLDHFKQVNDRFGHDKGDEVLAMVSAVLGNALRASDFAGRLGGEEFLVLAPDTHPGGALVLAEKLRQAISRAEVPGAEHVTASFGVASVPEDAVAPDPLLRRADRALYAAKEHGRDRVEQAAGATPA